MADNTVRMKLSELIVDYGIYPRSAVDPHHVGEMREAERAGVKFPPYVADAKSKRLTDGFHRRRKDQLDHGDDHEVDVILRDYASEAEMLLDAMRMNASHGRRLTKHDRARCFILAKKFRLGMSAVAAALGMTLSDVKAVGEGRVANVAVRSDEKPKAGEPRPLPRLEMVPLKRTVAHLAGTTITRLQAEAMPKVSGMPAGFHVSQLILLIDTKMLDTSDVDLMGRLSILREKLDSVLASGAVAK